jgi:hypothetical protein
MRPLLSLILLFGLYSSSRAQVIDQSFDVFPCINLDNEFYDIRSNQPLSLADYNLISNLDHQLFINNLYPQDCFMFKLNKSDIVTFKLLDRDRSYLIENNKPTKVFDYYPTKTIIINIEN